MATSAASGAPAHLGFLAVDTDPLASLRSEFEVEVAGHALGFYPQSKVEGFLGHPC